VAIKKPGRETWRPFLITRLQRRLPAWHRQWQSALSSLLCHNLWRRCVHFLLAKWQKNPERPASGVQEVRCPQRFIFLLSSRRAEEKAGGECAGEEAKHYNNNLIWLPSGYAAARAAIFFMFFSGGDADAYHKIMAPVVKLCTLRLPRGARRRFLVLRDSSHCSQTTNRTFQSQ
jgi:hypothetical protein